MNIAFPQAVPVLEGPRSETFRRAFNRHYAHLQHDGTPALEAAAAQLAHTFALREEVRRGSGR
jgi:hypothetical protein